MRDTILLERLPPLWPLLLAAGFLLLTLSRSVTGKRGRTYAVLAVASFLTSLLTFILHIISLST